jgi:micrococcal nuclease
MKLYQKFMQQALLVGALLLSWGGVAWAETLNGLCVAVYDGDTLTIQVGERKEKIRLLGIDAPEMKQAPWGKRSRDFARSLALSKQVRIETDVQPRDRYGRLLGYAYVGDTFINHELIRQGHAVLLTYPPNVKHVELFTAAQKDARSKGLGIWDPKSPLDVTPRDFRRGGKPAAFSRGEGLKVVPSGAPRASAADQRAASTATVRFNKRSKRYHTDVCGHSCQTCESISVAEAKERGGKPCRSKR